MSKLIDLGILALWAITIVAFSPIWIPILVVGALIGMAWGIATRPCGDTEVAHLTEAVKLRDLPILPRFRRDAWYTRLYVQAYGTDRAWFALWIAVWRTGSLPAIAISWLPQFDPTYDLPRGPWGSSFDAYRAERYRRLSEPFEAPKTQPFVDDGKPISICPTFWRIMLACYVYVPFVTFPRWCWRQIGWYLVRGAALAAVGAASFAVATAAYEWYEQREEHRAREQPRLVESIPPPAAPSLPRETEAARAQRIAAERPALMQQHVQACVEEIRAYHQGSYPCSAGYSLPHTHVAQLEALATCEWPVLSTIEALQDHNFTCMPWWVVRKLREHFPTDADREQLAGALIVALKREFSEAIAQERSDRATRRAQAAERDHTVLTSVTARLSAAAGGSAFDFYREFGMYCRRTTRDDRWTITDATPLGITKDHCTALARTYAALISAAESAIAWQEFWEDARVLGTDILIFLGVLLGCVTGGVAIVGFLWLVDRFAPVLGRLLWWTIVALTAPVWAPLWYVIWPILRGAGLAITWVWRREWFARIRAVLWRSFRWLGRTIVAIARTIRQAVRDTAQFGSAFAAAKWRKLCPHIEWR